MSIGLEALEEEYEEVDKALTEVERVIRVSTLQVSKSEAEIKSIGNLLLILQENYSRMKEAPIVLLSEYSKVKQYIPMNKQLLAEQRQKLNAAHKALNDSKQRLPFLQKQSEALEEKMNAWGKVISFDDYKRGQKVD